MTKDIEDIAALPFEKAMEELEAIVDRLEKGAVALEESIKLYERGESLKKHCDELLKRAWSPKRKAFTAALDSDDLDATALAALCTARSKPAAI